MTTKPDLQNLLDQIQERAKTAGDHVAKLCTKEDRWKMSVPVQDDDSDILLTQITDRDVPQLAKALRAVLELLSAVEEDPSNKLSFMYGGEPFPVTVTTNEVRQAITDALEVDGVV